MVTHSFVSITSCQADRLDLCRIQVQKSKWRLLMHPTQTNTDVLLIQRLKIQKLEGKKRVNLQLVIYTISIFHKRHQTNHYFDNMCCQQKPQARVSSSPRMNRGSSGVHALRSLRFPSKPPKSMCHFREEAATWRTPARNTSFSTPNSQQWK